MESGGRRGRGERRGGEGTEGRGGEEGSLYASSIVVAPVLSEKDKALVDTLLLG